MKKLIIPILVMFFLASFAYAKEEFLNGTELVIDDSIEIKLKNSVAELEIEDNKYKYKDDNLGIEIEYEITSKGVKESIIFNSKPSFSKIEFTLDTGNYNYKYYSNGDLVLFDKNKRPVGRFKAPFIVETGHRPPTTYDGNTYTISLSNIDWGALTFPVVIDPTYEREDFYYNGTNYMTDGMEGDASIDGVTPANDTAPTVRGWTAYTGSPVYTDEKKLQGNLSIKIDSSDGVRMVAGDNASFTGSLGASMYLPSSASTSLYFYAFDTGGNFIRMGGLANNVLRWDESGGGSDAYCDIANSTLSYPTWANITFSYYADSSSILASVNGIDCHNFTGKAGLNNLLIAETSGTQGGFFDEIWIANGDKPDAVNVPGSFYVDSARIEPTSPITNNNLSGYATGVSTDNSSIINFRWRWYRNGSLFTNGTTLSLQSKKEYNLNNLSYENTTGGDNWIFSASIFNTTNTSSWLNSSSVTISSFQVGNCTEYTYNMANYTILDEINESRVKSDVTLDFNVTLGGESDRYQDTINNVDNFSVCTSSTNLTFTVDYTIQYSSDTYTSRRYENNSEEFDENTKLINLYALETAQGIYARFLVLDQFDNVIPTVKSVMKKTISGTKYIIESGETDGSGIVAFFVSPDFDYDYKFTKSGYPDTSATIRTTSTDTQIVVMGRGLGVEENGTMDGIVYNFYPKSSTLNNATSYDFMFNMTSSYWQITNCTLKLELSNSSLLQESSSSFTDSTCDIRITQDTSNYTRIISKLVFVQNSTTSVTLTKDYLILYTYEGQFSLKNFFDDIKSFDKAGIDDRARIFIVFIAILVITVIVTSRIEIPNPEGTLILVWALVFFFSFLNMITINISGIPEGMGALNQYLIFILYSLFTTAYILWRHS